MSEPNAVVIFAFSDTGGCEGCAGGVDSDGCDVTADSLCINSAGCDGAEEAGDAYGASSSGTAAGGASGGFGTVGRTGGTGGAAGTAGDRTT